MLEGRMAVAVYLTHPDNPDYFLIVRRPDNSASLPGVWGLPAVELRRKESTRDGIKRLGKEKLDTVIEPEECLGMRSDFRSDHFLYLLDYRARLTGREPSVTRIPRRNRWGFPRRSTLYVAQEWTNDLGRLQEAADRGSLCSTIILEHAGRYVAPTIFSRARRAAMN